MFYIVLISSIFIDFVTKYAAYTNLNEKVSILWNFFFLKYAENPGIAFSIEIPTLLLKVMTIVLIITIFYYYRQENKTLSKKDSLIHNTAFWLILGGAIANGYERIFHEKVIDFIWVQGFAIFNMADAFITIGAIIYLYMIFIAKKINF